MTRLHEQQSQDQVSIKRYPFTNNPEGWFFVARSRDLPTGKLSSLSWLGNEIVMWRHGPDDVPSIAIAFCPHLGARLSPEFGGKLIDGLLVCPFHGFRYDRAGYCVATSNPNDRAPKNCRLDMIPVCEVNGMIMGYNGGTPRFHVPELDDNGWTSKLWGRQSLRTHVQDVVENMVDLNHFTFVHGYKRVDQSGQPVVDECHFTTSMDVIGRLNVPFVKNRTYNTSVEFDLWGLGYFFWETSSLEFGIHTRNWGLCVPNNDELVLHYAVAVRMERGSSAGALRLLPDPLSRRLIRKLVLYETSVTLKQDEHIWNGKSYREKPRLIPTDGPIYKYRQYCQQFY